MRTSSLVAALLIWATAAWPDGFGLRITIQSSGLPSGDLNAKLHYSLEQTKSNLVPVSNSATLKNDERNKYSQFAFSFDDLHFENDASRGYFWGEIEDLDGEILRRIPLTVFDEADLSDRRLLIRSVGSKALGIEALSSSYPIHLVDSSFLDTENVSFSLQAVRTLIDGGFVNSADEWQRIFDKFTANLSFFRSSGSADVGLILMYLHERYEILKKANTPIDIYSKFYIRFLTRLLELDIGGVVAPDGSRLDEYSINRMRQIIGEHGVALLEQVSEVQDAMIRMHKAAACLEITQAMLVEINADQGFWETIEARTNDEQIVKVFLKRFADCAQRWYVLTGDESASMIRFDKGFENLVNKDKIGVDIILNFFETAEKLEKAGLLSQTQRKGPFEQIYIYYNQAIERMAS